MTFVESFGKSVDIGILYIIYFIIAFVLLYISETILGPSKATIDTPTVWLILELIVIFFVFGIICHYIQLSVQQITLPFTISYNQPTDFSEGTWVLIYVFLTCSVNIQNRLYVLYNRIMGTDYPLVYTTVENRLSMFRR